jgi:hypothetical protein
LRQQLVIYKRTAIRPSLRRRDRLVWVGLAKIWAGWKQPLVIVGFGGRNPRDTSRPCSAATASGAATAPTSEVSRKRRRSCRDGGIVALTSQPGQLALRKLSANLVSAVS